VVIPSASKNSKCIAAGFKISLGHTAYYKERELGIINIDGTAEFGWGPEDPVEQPEGQLEVLRVVVTESSGGSPLSHD
jgi:hypothetical protein